MRLAWYLLTNWHNICLHVYIFNLVDRMAGSTVHQLIKKTKTTTMEYLKGQYRHIETIITGKRSYKAKHDLIETGLRNEIDCDTMDQNCYDEIYMTPNIEKSIPGKHSSEMSFTLKDDAGVKLSASDSSHEQTPFCASCLSGDVDSVREILNKQKDCEGNIALMLAVSGGHKHLVRVLIEEFRLSVNTSKNGKTLVHEACCKGHTDLVRELIVEHGADLSAKDNNKNDALMYAVTGGHQDLVRILIKEFQFSANTSRGKNGRTPLLDACLRGHIDLVRELVVEHGADLSAKDNDNNDALMCAVIGGHQDLVRILIKEFQFSVNTSRGRNGRTPLLEACLKGHTDLVRELVVEHGADLSAKDNNNNDALMYAVIGGHQDLVRVLIKEFHFYANMSRGRNGRTPLLGACCQGRIDLVRQLVVEHGADLSAKDNNNNDALMYAVTGGHQDLVRILIKEFQFSANTSRGINGRTPLLEACLKGHTDLVRELVVEHGADLSAKDNNNNDALMYAVIGGHQDLVRVLIKEFHFYANMSRGRNGRTPLLGACCQGRIDLVRQLVVEHGADLSAKYNDNNDALMCAVFGGHQDLVRVLIKEFQFSANTSRGRNGRTPLLEACLEGHTDLVRELVVEHGADLSAKDNNNNDALMLAVIGGHQDLVRVLIKEFHFYANMSRERNGRTPLFGACCQGRIDLVRQLVVEHGADLSAKDNDNNDALMCAVFGGHQDLVRVLIKEFHFCANTSRGINGRTPLLEACIEGHIDLVRELVVEHGADLSAKDNNNNDALMFAAIGDHQDLVRILIKEFHFSANSSREHGADLTAIDNDSDDALMCAVIGGHQDLVRVLIKEFHFNANTGRGSDGITPLLEACCQGRIDLVRQLVVEHGADLSAKDNDNNDALMCAVFGGHQDLVRVLIKEFHFCANTSRGINERTPLLEACIEGHIDLVRELVVEHGADLSAKDNNNNDALMLAVNGGLQDLVRVLIKEFNFYANTSRGSDGRTPLLEACFEGHIDLVRQLVVEHGADLSAKDNDNYDSLLFAVSGSHQDLVRILIKEFHFSANTSRGINGRTPLLEACFEGLTDLVRQLVVEHGADLSAKDNNNNDALMFAAIGDHQDLVRILIKEFHFSANSSREHGADLTAIDNDSDDTLMCAVFGGHQDLVRVLIKEFHFNANTSRGSDGRTPLLEACYQGHIDLVRELVVEHGADLSAKDNNNNDALMLAVIGGHQDLVRVLIKEFNFNANMSQGLNGRPPLHQACIKGHTDLVRQLVVEHGADLSAKDNHNFDALMYAVIGGHQDLVRVLIKEFNFNANTSRGSDGRTPLLEACLRGHIDLVRQLVVEHGADVGAKDIYNRDALMYAVAGGHQGLVRVLIKEFDFNVNMNRKRSGKTHLLEACFKGHTDLMRQLVVEHGADLTANDNDNDDALMCAVIGGHQDLVRVLIKEFNFNANTSRGSDGRTPLLEACYQGHIDLVRQLVVEHGADLSAKDNDNYDALMYAVIVGHQDLVRILIKEFSFNANMSRGLNGRTPLHQACIKGHTDLVRQLVVWHGADVGSKDNDNWDALMHVVCGGHQDLVRVLIKEFCFIANTSRGSDGRTPLHQACIKGHIDLVRQLVVEHEADLSARSNVNYDALMYAVAGGHKEIVKILINDFGFRVNAFQELTGETPLLVACKQGHTDLVIKLVYDLGADLDAKDADGDNALMYAVVGNHPKVAELLIDEFGFDVNAGNFYGCTPLLMAFYHNHIDLAMDLIYKFEADVNAQDMYGHNCLMYAAQGGSLAAAGYLLAVCGFDVIASGHCGETALLVACYYGHISFFTDLFAEIGDSLDLEAEDDNGNNALMYAVDGCQEAAVRVLVEDHGFDVNSSNHALQTPVILASMEGNVGLLNILVKELGVSLLCEDKNGETPFSIAVSEGQQNIVELLATEFFNDVEKWLVAN